MKKKLIIHIGMGKTGSTSIQMSLNSQHKTLRDNGIFYLGLMLENASTRTYYSWHKPSGWGDLIALPKGEANCQVIEAFNEINSTLPENINTLIWSNESFFDSASFIKPLLVQLAEMYDLHIVGYLRRPDDWIVSAYLQWGIKHKSYTGPLKTFKQWSSDAPYTVAAQIDSWSNIVDSYKFYNFNEISNILEHFTSVYLPDVSLEKNLRRFNDTPSSTALALFSAYNSTFSREVLPNEIAPLLSKAGLMQRMPPPRNHNDLLPSKDDLDNYVKTNEQEISKANAKLISLGQKPFKINDIVLKDRTTSQADINRHLLKIIVDLSNEIDDIKKKMQ